MCNLKDRLKKGKYLVLDLKRKGCTLGWGYSLRESESIIHRLTKTASQIYFLWHVPRTWCIRNNHKGFFFLLKCFFFFPQKQLNLFRNLFVFLGGGWGNCTVLFFDNFIKIFALSFTCYVNLHILPVIMCDNIASFAKKNGDILLPFHVINWSIFKRRTFLILLIKIHICCMKLKVVFF